jgi:hypothetical protein
MRLGKVYYAKRNGGRSMFVAPHLIRHFNAVFGLPRSSETLVLSQSAQKVLKVLSKEWEMGTKDLRIASEVRDKRSFNNAMEELQRVFKIVPSEAVYRPTLTYLWTTVESRFRDE